ncbi:hypothetical protein [Deinococcus sonorensis]|uniref:DUF3224 domain-containing protein n=2 Tax=Deinococcus sonorensis TaxID=309891 RepID=A0AAU7UES8_9DEIO
MRIPLPIIGLSVVLAACAPSITVTSSDQVSKPRLQTQVYEGAGTGVLSSARYRMALNVDAAGGSANGVFYNLTSGNNYAVQGAYVPTAGGADMALKLYTDVGGSISASAVVRDFRLGAEAKQAGELTGMLRGVEFSGKLRLLTGSISVQLHRTE